MSIKMKNKKDYIGIAMVFFSPIIAVFLFSSNSVYAQSYPTYETTKSTANLSGTASDDISLARVSWVNDRGGSGNAIGTNSWSITSIVLQTGRNLITITAWDSGGNYTADSLVINYTLASTTSTTTDVITPVITPVVPVRSSGGGGGGGSSGGSSISGSRSAPTISVNPPTSYLPSLTGPFSFGIKGDQVKVLQQYLAQDSVIYPTGMINGIYDQATAQAVWRFQTKYGIPTELSSRGLAGPITRQKIIQVLGSSTTENGLLLAQRQTLITQLRERIKQLITELIAMLQQEQLKAGQ